MATVMRKGLVDVLNQVKPGIGNKESDIQATCLVFDDGMVYSYNDELSVTQYLPKGLKDVCCAVQAKELIALLSKLKDEEIDLFLDGTALHIHGKRAKAELVIEREIRMPIGDIKYPKKLYDLPEDFGRALKLCLPIVGRDLSLPLSTCLHLNGDLMEASDVDKAARYIFNTKFPFDDAIFLPGTAARHLTQYKLEAVAVTKGWIHFETADNVLLSCRTYYKGQQFANLTPLLDQKGTDIELPTELADAMDRSGIFTASAEAGDSESDQYVLVTIEDDWCIVQGEGAVGRYTEKVRLKYSGRPIVFATKAEILLNAISDNMLCTICERHVKMHNDEFCHLVAVRPPRKKEPKHHYDDDADPRFPSEAGDMDEVPF